MEEEKYKSEMEMYHPDNDNPNYSWLLGIIIGLLVTIIVGLFSIRGTLEEIYSDTHYTSASTDYLKNIENILEDIRSQR